MIDIDEMRNVLKQCDIYVKENDKNFICKCPYCGDHHNKEKQGHLYVSKSDIIPTAHCWYCQGAWPTQKLLFDITGSKREDIIQVDEYKKENIKSVKKSRLTQYQIPELDSYNFSLKLIYMKNRVLQKIDIDIIPNLIFDIKKFFEINNLNIRDFVADWEVDMLQNCSVCFLSRNHTTLYCRSIVKDSKFPFRKIILQKDPLNMLDYYCIDNGHINSNVIVLSEGNFDILGCYATDILKLNDKARIYAAGCTFAYPELLKSVCFDYSIYNADVTILSDSDKKKYHYKKLLTEFNTMYTTINIVYNQLGKDFGTFPQYPVKLF